MSNFASEESEDLTASELNTLIKSTGNEDEARRILAVVKKLMSTAAEVVVPTGFMTINPDLDFADHIKRGNYYYTENDLMLTEKKFPITNDQLGEWKWKLFHFNRRIFSEEPIRLIKEDGFEPGQIAHILTFGEINPEERWRYPIIGLGSVAKVGLYQSVPVLWYDNVDRRLSLYQSDSVWSKYCRFLGVRRCSIA